LRRQGREVVFGRPNWAASNHNDDAAAPTAAVFRSCVGLGLTAAVEAS
jgi:hypothetical protein